MSQSRRYSIIVVRLYDPSDQYGPDDSDLDFVLHRSLVRELERIVYSYTREDLLTDRR